MSAHMRTQTIGESAEISLSIIVPIPELELTIDSLKRALAQAGLVVRPVNEEGDEIYSADEIFTEAHSGMTLRGFRTRDDLTKEELADRLGVKESRISALESGKRPVSVTMAKQLAKIFDVTYKVFL